MENSHPTIRDADTLIVGGGVAGLAAAISSAAAGSETVLIEKSDRLGGNISLANVHTFCGLFELKKNDHLEYLNSGFTPWFVEGLRKSGGALDPEKHGRVGVLPVFPSRVAEYALNIVRKFPTLTVMRETTLIGLNINSPHNTQAEALLRHQGEEQLLSAKTVIDSSGDAIAATLSGAEIDTPAADQLQNASLIFRVTGANPNDLVGYSRLKLSANIARRAFSGDIPEECESVLVRPGEKFDEAYISLNLPKLTDHVYAPLDSEFMGLYKQHALELAQTLIACLVNYMPGWSKCQLLEWPHLVGIRETQHIVGKYVMTESDILSGATHPDAIARSSWPIELWNKHTGADFKYPDSISEIPLRSLMSKSHANLGMAGRCMSGTHEALGALRISGTAMATGEAIGIAASIAAEKEIPLAEVPCEDVKTRHENLKGTVFNYEHNR